MKINISRTDVIREENIRKFEQEYFVKRIVEFWF